LLGLSKLELEVSDFKLCIRQIPRQVSEQHFELGILYLPRECTKSPHYFDRTLNR
jgi:hypothetical protein